jgi:hypothetical protein
MDQQDVMFNIMLHLKVRDLEELCNTNKKLIGLIITIMCKY